MIANGLGRSLYYTRFTSMTTSAGLVVTIAGIISVVACVALRIFDKNKNRLIAYWVTSWIALGVMLLGFYLLM